MISTMSEYYSPRPALISNPAQGIVFNYPNKAATEKINTPAVTVFQTADPVLFSPLTDGLFEKVGFLDLLHDCVTAVNSHLFALMKNFIDVAFLSIMDTIFFLTRNIRCGERDILFYSMIALSNL